MTTVRLVLGGSESDRVIDNADLLLRRYREDTGCDCLHYQPITPQDRVVPEDLAVTLLVNSQAGWRAFRSLQLHSASLDLTHLPQRSLEQTTVDERTQVKEIMGSSPRGLT